MFVNRTDHYDNQTTKTNDPGLFYLNPLRRLSNNSVLPTSDLYTYDNWNFSVNATSGDSQQMNITLLLKKGSGGFDECENLNECANITTDICDNCQQDVYYWYKNFTQDDVGTWFYQIKMINNATGVVETQTTGTDSFSVNDITQEQINFTEIVNNPNTTQWGGTTVTFNVTV